MSASSRPSSTFLCQASVCTDTSSGYGLAVAATRTRLPADGAATSTVTALVKSGGTAASGVRVDFATDLGTFVGGTTATTTSATTGSDGTAVVIFKASATTGTANVTAAVHIAPQVNQTALVTMPALGSIQLSAMQNSGVMGVKFSGWFEQNQISVKLLDDHQLPYPDGLAVRFEHQQLGGSTISPPWTADTGTCLQANNCLGYLGQTTSANGKVDTDGLAYVNLYSGTAAGLVSVTASATVGGATRTFTVQNIAFIGAKASGAHFTVDCTPKNLPALRDRDCLTSFYEGAAAPITCKAFFADRFGNILGRSLLTTFATEAGAPGQPVSTAQYDPAQPGQTASLGFATEVVNVKGYKLPLDVDPLAGEPKVATAPDICGKTTWNPRDGLVTIIAMARGEEGFVDLNANGVHDPTEPYIDQGEPFVDENDNNVRDANEPFVDLNGNGQYDGPNGAWDADTTIWTETRVLYSGMQNGGTSLANPATLTIASGASPGTKTSNFVFTDENLNPLSPKYTTYVVASDQGACTPTITGVPGNVDNLGILFTQQYCDKLPPAPGPVCGSTCATVPCYQLTAIGGYAAGSYGVVTVKGGANPGTDVVRITPTVDQVTLQVPISIPITLN